MLFCDEVYTSLSLHTCTPLLPFLSPVAGIAVVTALAAMIMEASLICYIAFSTYFVVLFR